LTMATASSLFAPPPALAAPPQMSMAATAETKGFVDQLFTIVSRLDGTRLQTQSRCTS
jgi:hypothetical protein